MKWFKHDSDAHRDAKLKRVQMKYGMEGYGLYWHCIELIAGSVDQYNITFELEHDSEIIAHDTGIHRERVQEMMEYMIRLELFENSGGTITCMKLAKRMDQSMTSNPGMRKAISNLRDNIELESIKSHDNVMTKSSQNRIEQNRRDNNKGNKSPSTVKKFIPPTIKQVIQYCTERGNSVDPQRWHDFYTAKGWMIGKNKMKDWRAAVRTWERKQTESQDNNGSDQFKGAL